MMADQILNSLDAKNNSLKTKIMTVRQLTKELILIKDSLQDKEVVIRTENGELLSPDVKFVLKDKFNMDKTKENVEFVILTVS